MPDNAFGSGQSSVVAQLGHAFVLGAMGAAKDFMAFLQPMADDADAAMGASRRKRVDRTLETVEDVGRAVHLHLKRLVVIVAAGFASGHGLASRDVRGGKDQTHGSRARFPAPHARMTTARHRSVAE